MLIEGQTGVLIQTYKVRRNIDRQLVHVENHDCKKQISRQAPDGP